jgi:hypothetical protein
MKITKRQLQRIIKEERARSRVNSRHSLVSLLFEEEEPGLTGDVGQDLEAAFNAGPEGVRAFMDKNKDKAVTDVLVKAAEEHDGAASDDVINVGSASPINVSDLGPTQQFIDLMQSVSFPLGSAKVLDGAISSKTSGAPGAISISGDAILDGHHRWSSVYAITPDGNINAKDFGFPGGVKEKLAAAQMAVAAVKPGTGQPSKGGSAATDIMGKGSGDIVAMIDANKGKQTDANAPGPLLNDKMIKSIADGTYPGINVWAEIPEDAEFVALDDSEAGFANDPIRRAIAEKVGGNLASLPSPLAGAPKSREDMPQLDHEDIGGDQGLAKIEKGLPAGEYNVVPPFTTKEAKRNSGNELILERWQKIAGITRKAKIREALEPMTPDYVLHSLKSIQQFGPRKGLSRLQMVMDAIASGDNMYAVNRIEDALWIDDPPPGAEEELAGLLAAAQTEDDVATISAEWASRHFRE